MVDIARSPDVARKKKIRRILFGGAALVVIILITVAVSRLKPAAPGVGRYVVGVDPRKPGGKVRPVRGGVPGHPRHQSRQLVRRHGVGPSVAVAVHPYQFTRGGPRPAR